MSHLKWPVLVLLVSEVLNQFPKVFSQDEILIPTKQDGFFVQHSHSNIDIQNVTLLKSSQISPVTVPLPVEVPAVLSPDFLSPQSQENINISTTFLEPNTAIKNATERTHNSTIDIQKPNINNDKYNITSLVEPEKKERSQNFSKIIFNDTIFVSPIYVDALHKESIGTEIPSITDSQIDDDEEIPATLSDSQSTFPPTLQTEKDSVDITTILSNNLQQQQELTEVNTTSPQDIIEHIKIPHKSKTLTITTQKDHRGIIHSSVDETKTSTKWDIVPETRTPVYTQIPVESETAHAAPNDKEENYESSTLEYESKMDADVQKQHSNNITRVSVSESLIESQNPDQEIHNPRSIKTRPQDSKTDSGMLMTTMSSLHPNDVMHFTSSDIYPGDSVFNVSVKEVHPCSRTCLEDAPPMICRFTFTLEWYYTMSKACYNCPLNFEDCERKDCVVADGVRRPIVVVNRQMPGPSVEVCKGDRIIVNMENSMMEESTTIHWHGHHQRGTPYMDGVPYVTQCPIPPKAIFQYHYVADTPGTHFWHSHTGCQRADGAFGALIIRVPPSVNPHRKLYDRDLSEHIIQILDWDHKLGVEKFLAHHHANGNNKPETLLVNGRGRFHQFEDVDGIPRNATYSPTAKFTVQKGLRYRFRLINAGFLNCPIELSVDNHTLLIISSDGSDLKPVEAESLVTYAGERFDFVLNANQNIGNYWMRFRGLMDCDERFTSAHQVAILHYDGASEFEEPPGEVNYEAARRKGLQVNSLNVGSGSDDSLVVPELNATTEDDESLAEKPDMTFYLSYDFYKIDNPHYHRAPYYGFHQVNSTKMQLLTPQLNYISLKLPPFPLLSQHSDLGTNYHFCNETTVHNCTGQYCECTHVIEVPLGAVLELILIDKGNAYDANHPFHLHGHAFRVVAMERLGSTTSVEEVQNLDKAGLIQRKLHNAPIKDTVTVPDGGFTIVRVHASNPGYWLFHCHIEFHVELGMAVVFKVGDHKDFPPPPRNFPKCNNYMPPDEDLDGAHNDMDNEIGVPVISTAHWWPLRSSGSSRILVLPLIPLLILSAAVR